MALPVHVVSLRSFQEDVEGSCQIHEEGSDALVLSPFPESGTGMIKRLPDYDVLKGSPRVHMIFHEINSENLFTLQTLCHKWII